MLSDNTTFFLAFAAIFLGLAAYVWHLEREAKRLQQRVDALEALTAKAKGADAPARPKA